MRLYPVTQSKSIVLESTDPLQYLRKQRKTLIGIFDYIEVLLETTEDVFSLLEILKLDMIQVPMIIKYRIK